MSVNGSRFSMDLAHRYLSSKLYSRHATCIYAADAKYEKFSIHSLCDIHHLHRWSMAALRFGIHAYIKKQFRSRSVHVSENKRAFWMNMQFKHSFTFHVSLWRKKKSSISDDFCGICKKLKNKKQNCLFTFHFVDTNIFFMTLVLVHVRIMFQKKERERDRERRKKIPAGRALTGWSKLWKDHKDVDYTQSKRNRVPCCQSLSTEVAVLGCPS